MESTKQTQIEAKKLVSEFKKKEEKGEFRNKLGRIWWPVWNRVVVPAVCLSTILTGNLAGIAFGAALWGASHPITKGFSVNVQNIAIRNAGLLGRSLRNRQIPHDVRKEAILEYLRQSGSLFFNKEWVKKHPEDIDKMADGQKGRGIPNLVATVETNLTRVVNHARKKNEMVPLRERLKVYQQSYYAYQQRKKEMNR